MEVTICRCGWGIAGVEELPPHWHMFMNALVGTGRYWERGPFTGQEIMAMEQDPYIIHIVVDWKEVYRAATQETVPAGPQHLPQRSDGQEAGYGVA